MHSFYSIYLIVMSQNEFAKFHILQSMRSRLKVLISKLSYVTEKVTNKNPVGIKGMSENYQKHEYLKERIYTYIFIDDDKNAQS